MFLPFIAIQYIKQNYNYFCVFSFSNSYKITLWHTDQEVPGSIPYILSPNRSLENYFHFLSLDPFNHCLINLTIFLPRPSNFHQILTNIHLCPCPLIIYPKDPSLATKPTAKHVPSILLNIMFHAPMGRFQLELIYYFTYFSPSSHPTILCLFPVGLLSLIQHFQHPQDLLNMLY